MTSAHGDVVLTAKGITKRYPGTTALDGVDFHVRRGKVNVLIGENGAGKSTLVKIIAGVERPTSGRLFLENRELNLRSTHDADAYGISMIYQELNLCPNLTVAENLFLARELTSGRFAIDRARQREKAREVVSRLEPSISPDAVVGDLRLGEQQIVEIAKSLLREARILIMDEPTSALSGAEVEALFRMVRELTASGVSIVYISHRLEELLRIGDFITVLRDGRVVGEAPAAEVNIPWIVERMVGGRLESVFRRQERQPGAPCLEVRSLSLPASHGGFLFNEVTFTLRRGEVLGLYGLMGAGRTELLESLIGHRAGARGGILLDGSPIAQLDVAGRMAAGLALIPEDRQGAGIVPTLSVRDNMALASLGSFRTGPWLNDRLLNPEVDRLIRELAIRVTSARQPITSLSGGNQQKVVLAKGLLTRPKALLLDEPTRGVDVGAKAEICDIINRLAAEGMGVVLASSEIEEILGMADRILVMSKGAITAEWDRPEATETALVQAAAANLNPWAGGAGAIA